MEEETNVVPTPPTEFVWKLYMMLEEGNDDNVFWTPDGRSFVIADTIEFSKTTLPRHFRHKNFSSFVRQLNKYDFHKVKSTTEDGEPLYGENGWEFKHPQFLQFDTSGIDSIRRKLPEKKRTDGPASYRALEDELRDLKRKHERLQKHFTSLSEDFASALEKLSSLQESMKKKEETMSHVFSMLSEFEYRFERLGVPQGDTTSFDHAKRRRTDITTTTDLGENMWSVSSPQWQHSHQDVSPLPNTQLPKSSSHSPIMTGPRDLRQDPQGGTQRSQQQIRNVHDNSGIQKILLASDDPDCVKIGSTLLRKVGLVVDVVSDGLSAVDFLQNPTSQVNLILMETVLARLDGCSAVEVIRSTNTQVPIIMINDGPLNPKLKYLLQSGYINGVLSRPFSKEELFKALSPHVTLAY